MIPAYVRWWVSKRRVHSVEEIHVVKRDGSRELFDANKINLAIVKAAEGLPDPISKVVQVATAVQLNII